MVAGPIHGPGYPVINPNGTYALFFVKAISAKKYFLNPDEQK